MGGIFAVQAALQKPEQVQALVLVATSGGIDLSPFQVADWREDYQQSFTVPDWFVSASV
jgi:pimeloyl-ACP methyl ester carboxylesterase